MKRIMALMLAVMLMALPARAVEAMDGVILADSAQTFNALLAAEKIGQTRLKYGETFSFNDTVGPRTEENGFVPALNGRGVEVVGGGCAQSASALYMALCNLSPGSVAFDELSFYGDRYSGSYVESGSQAVLVDYGNGRDFRFTNLCEGEMLIRFEPEDGFLTCVVSVEDVEEPEPVMTFQAVAPGRSCVTLPCGGDLAVNHNVTLAANSIYDTCLATGDVFSFNAVVGPRTESFGFVPAINGRGVESVGGGCARAASGLWLLVKDRADIEILEMSTYGSKYAQDYVESADDAILVDSRSGVDFSFRYIGPGMITLYAAVEDGALTCSIAQAW